MSKPSRVHIAFFFAVVSCNLNEIYFKTANIHPNKFDFLKSKNAWLLLYFSNFQITFCCIVFIHKLFKFHVCIVVLYINFISQNYFSIIPYGMLVKGSKLNQNYALHFTQLTKFYIYFILYYLFIFEDVRENSLILRGAYHSAPRKYIQLSYVIHGYILPSKTI